MVYLLYLIPHPPHPARNPIASKGVPAINLPFNWLNQTDLPVSASENQEPVAIEPSPSERVVSSQPS